MRLLELAAAAITASFSQPFDSYGTTVVPKPNKTWRPPSPRVTIEDTLGKSHGTKRSKRAARRHKGA